MVFQTIPWQESQLLQTNVILRASFGKMKSEGGQLEIDGLEGDDDRHDPAGSQLPEAPPSRVHKSPHEHPSLPLSPPPPFPPLLSFSPSTSSSSPPFSRTHSQTLRRVRSTFFRCEHAAISIPPPHPLTCIFENDQRKTKKSSVLKITAIREAYCATEVPESHFTQSFIGVSAISSSGFLWYHVDGLNVERSELKVR